jgi:hypothetical protein
MPRIEELTWMLEDGAVLVFVTLTVVPLVPPGKFTVAPAAGKPSVEEAPDELSVPLAVLRAKAMPERGEVVR